MNKFMKPGQVKEISGSVTKPEGARLALVFTPCSTTGTYKSDVYDKIVNRWAKVKLDYRAKFVNRENFKLGEIITSAVNSDIWVCQAICLNDKGKLDKEALEICIKKIISLANYEHAFVHLSQLTFKSFPAIKKLMPNLVSEAGLNLYCYSDAEPELLKR